MKAKQQLSHYTSTGAVFEIATEDFIARGKAPSHELCRKLVDAGFDGSLTVEDYHGNAKYVIKDIRAWSDLQTYEGDRTGIKIKEHKPFWGSVDHE